MTIVLYDYRDVEERSSESLQTWKAWHVVFFFLATICGVLNYVSMLNVNSVVDYNCALYPRKLEFKWVPIPDDGDLMDNTKNVIELDEDQDFAHITQTDQVKIRQIDDLKLEDGPGIVTEKVNETNDKGVAPDVSRLRLMLDTDRTLFAKEGTCTFPEYAPMLALIFALVWVVIFIMCPAGGRTNSFELPQPWRVLMPALAFTLVFAVVTGVNFHTTDAGIKAFCAAFYNLTNVTECAPVNEFLVETYNTTTWGVDQRVQMLRAAVAGSFACWVCACALLLARCIAAPDFAVRRTKVCLKDPAKKVIPQLQTSLISQRSSHSTISEKTEPTFLEPTTVTATFENEFESEPTSLLSTPAKVSPFRKGEAIELMTTSCDVPEIKNYGESSVTDR